MGDERDGPRDDAQERARAARERAVRARWESTARAILDAAEARDAVADARDAAAAKRENDLDRAELLDPTSDYGAHWTERRRAGLDRTHAERDRAAAREDLRRLTQGPGGASDGQPDGDSDRDGVAEGEPDAT